MNMMIGRFEILEALQKHWGGFFRQYQMALNELKSDFQIIDLEWKTRHGYSPIEHIKGRIKDPLSLIKKMERKNIPFNQQVVQEQIRDIAGLRIVTTFIDDVYMMKEHIEQREDIRVVQIKDYIQNPKPSGYMSLHLVVQTQVILSEGVLWIPAEIQLRTSSMDFWAATEHKLNYKYQGGDIPDEAKVQLKALAQSSFQMDRQMSLLRNQLLTSS
ncbi:GTP pyrophosphokinase family protein [Paenibacillus thiaminolyticus]|uniref:GTP pyrophosphokinase family protein n=1 Tax=Paenibacillus thiaminolyticus TaxID=49283 RepID=A0A3A3GY51_PANTH|nr:GTP pyrophosphokinase family protein [Paenibacillus thiaminolyticus]RJG23101.1 GTP pyrophosphokinase family protein [Paenibacillus thiaminolyticus]